MIKRQRHRGPDQHTNMPTRLGATWAGGNEGEGHCYWPHPASSTPCREFPARTLSNTESCDEKVIPFQFSFQPMTVASGKSTSNTIIPWPPHTSKSLPSICNCNHQEILNTCFCFCDYLLLRASESGFALTKVKQIFLLKYSHTLPKDRQGYVLRNVSLCH
jgi:hypothetical protein